MRPRSVSCTSNFLVHMFGFRKYTEVFPRVILSLQGLPQSQSLETILICIVVLCYQHDNIAEFTCVMNVRDQTRQRLSQDFVHFVTARASLFTDHKIASLPIRAKYRHFRTICEQIFDNSPTDLISSSSSLK